MAMLNNQMVYVYIYMEQPTGKIDKLQTNP